MAGRYVWPFNGGGPVVKLQTYFSSPSVQLGICLGGLMYASYAAAYQALTNVFLISLCLFVGFFVPFYSRISNGSEQWVNSKTALVSAGRLTRFALQLAFNWCIFSGLTWAGVLPVGNLGALGGVIGVALLTTFASQGMQYAALALANREIGDRNRNVLMALSVNIVVTALATVGIPWVSKVFLVVGLTFGLALFGLGLLSDGRAWFFPRHGVGVFLGTFNPIHSTHISLIRDAIASRGLEKVYLHCTEIPKLHGEALKRGEIEIARYEGGMRVYQKTEKADVHLNYFPTGSRFYEYENRLEMMRMAVADAGLSDRVEVLSWPEIYAKDGFYGVLKVIKRLANGRPIHAIHGSDLGGMWVRGICDESGWIYPYPVIRRDKVSATAIRNGAIGMTTQSVQAAMERLRYPPSYVSNGSVSVINS